METETQLHQNLNNLCKMLADPLTPNKSSLQAQMHQIQTELLRLNAMPYFCSECGFIHKTGEIYLHHKPYATFRPPFPPVKVYRIDKNHHILLEKTGFYHAETKLENVTLGTTLDLVLENHRILVKIRGDTIGEIPPGNQRFREISSAITQAQIRKNCFLEQYRPSEYTKIITESWIGNRVQNRSERFENHILEEIIVTVQLIDDNKFKSVVQGLIEMIPYHPDPLQGFIALGPKVINELESHNQHAKDPKITEIIDKLHMQFKIPTKNKLSLLI